MFSGYSDRASAALLEPLRHVHKLEINSRELDVQNMTLTFDETRSPHVSMTATCKVPEDQAYLDSLDPRAKPRVFVSLGYQYAGGEEDMHLVANLSLTSRTVDRPDNTITLVADSDEVLVGEYGRAFTDLSFGTSFNPLAAITTLINMALPTAPVQSETGRPNITTDADQPYLLKVGDDPMRVITDLADQAVDLWVYDDGLRTFHIRNRPELGETAHNLTVGQNGTIISSSTTMSRMDWANAVMVRHAWTSPVTGVDIIQDGLAQVTSGPYAVDDTSRTLMIIERTTPASVYNATQSAQSILRRIISRGRSFELDAVSAYWLRPGDTVTVKLPTGEQERHLVASVRFESPGGRMSVVTRLPQDVEIT